MSDEIKQNENQAKADSGKETPPKSANNPLNEAETKPNSSATARPNPASTRPAYNFEADLRTFALNGLLKGIGNVINFVNEVAERIEERAEQTREQAAQNPIEKQGEIDLKVGGANARIGYSIRGSLERIDAALAGRPPTAPPPAARLNPSTAPDVLTTREPMLDIFDEAAENIIIVVVELPGVAEKDIVVEIQDDILYLKASGKTYQYEKEALLPAIVESTPVSRHYQNGMLELRLKRVATPGAAESDNQ